MPDVAIEDCNKQSEEEEVYKQKWREWNGKIRATVLQRALPGVVGCTFDDLMSLAHQVMLYSIRGYKPDRYKFSTFFYTNLHNAIKSEYARAGLVRQCYRIRITDKKTSKVTVLSKAFATEEEAKYVAGQIGRGRRISDVFFDNPSYRIRIDETTSKAFLENRVKRIPPPEMISLDAPAPADSEGQENDGHLFLLTNKSLCSNDKRRVAHSELIKIVGRRIPDRINRRILWGLYTGSTIRQVAMKLHKPCAEVDKRIKRMRRTALEIARTFKF